MNAVKSGSIAIGSPSGAAATVFPEMGAFLVPYLVKDYAHAYAMFNGKIGDKLDQEIQDKYKLKVLCFYDFGFRHFWTSKKPIIEPRDLRGQKIRVQQAKVFGDTINGLGGNAVPMGWGEVITAAKSGVIDGGDLPIVNIKALKVYEVSKYVSMSYPQLRPDQRRDEPGNLERAHARSSRRCCSMSRARRRARSARRPSRSTTSPRRNPSSSRSAWWWSRPRSRNSARSRSRRSGRPTRASTARCGTRSRVQGLSTLSVSPQTQLSSRKPRSGYPGSISHSLKCADGSRLSLRLGRMTTPHLPRTQHAPQTFRPPQIRDHGADHLRDHQPADRRGLLRYFVGAITDWLDVDPVPFTWVEELGEMSLAWLTADRAAVGIQQRRISRCTCSRTSSHPRRSSGSTASIMR
jgi:hypothetical protein